MAIKHSTVKAALQKLFAVADWNADHTGTLDHATEITNVTSDQHHAQIHNAASHSDIASTGAQIDDAVSKKHTQGTDTTLGNMTAAINMNTHQINNVVDPTANQDAATKKWVEDLIPGPGTSYLSIPATQWVATYESFAYDLGQFDGNYELVAQGADVFAAHVNLPHGAVVTAVVVYGSNVGETWVLKRAVLDAPAAESTMATAALNTEDNTISDATIDNTTYQYYLYALIAEGNKIYGTRITYTL